MRAAAFPLILIAAASALTVPLGGSSYELSKREVQGGNGKSDGPIDGPGGSSEQYNEDEEVNGEIGPDSRSEIDPVFPDDQNDLFADSVDGTQEPQDEPSPLPSTLQAFREKQALLRGFNRFRRQRADPGSTEALFDDSLHRYPLTPDTAQRLLAYMQRVMLTVQRSGMTVSEGIAMQFAQLDTSVLQQELSRIISFAQENERLGSSGSQLPEQLVALAEDHAIILLVSLRASGSGISGTSSMRDFLMQRNPFITEERATEIARIVESQYQPLPPRDSRLSLWRRLTNWWNGLFD